MSSSEEEEMYENPEKSINISLADPNLNIQRIYNTKKIKANKFKQNKSSRIKMLNAKNKKNNTKNHIKVNLNDTQYSVIEYVMKKFNFKIVKESGDDCDFFWTDKSVSSDKVSSLKPYQKINHFPAMHCLSRKDELAINLNKIIIIFPNEFTFVPKTWILPADFITFKLYCKRNSKKTFIVKPWDSSQGKGIFLTNDANSINRTERYIAQKYISKPYLINNLKFDLRIYCLVYGCDPLRIFIYKEGLARFATENYYTPCEKNFSNSYVHLTNYAINKHSPKFIFNNDVNNPTLGHKKCLEFVWNYIDDHGGNSSKLKNDIYECIVKTICSVQPILAQSYRTCLPMDLDNNKCFEILGFDILIDSDLRPWLLEVNHSPSFTTDTPFDLKLKSDLIYDTVNLLNLNESHELKKEMKKNLMQNISNEQFSEKKKQKEIRMRKRDEFENNNLGGYIKVFPNKNYKYFDEIIKASFSILCTRNLEVLKKSLKNIRNNILENLKIRNSYFTTPTNVNYEKKNDSKEVTLPLIKVKKSIFNQGQFNKSQKRELIPTNINLTETSIHCNDYNDTKKMFKLENSEISDTCYNGEENENSTKNMRSAIIYRKFQSNTSRNSDANKGLSINWIYKFGYLKEIIQNLKPTVERMNLSIIKQKSKFGKSQIKSPKDKKADSINKSVKKEFPRNLNNVQQVSVNFNKNNLMKFQNLVFQGMHPVSKNDLFMNK